MFHVRNRVGWSVAVALIAASTVSVRSTVALPRYDGIWSVSLVTTKGDCMASYRYPIRIANGIVANGGALAIDVSGKVAASGAVTVHVSHGDTHAAGFGRLSRTVGNGSWHGAGCSGSWTAERRSS
jgi:hypothetical protein